MFSRISIRAGSMREVTYLQVSKAFININKSISHGDYGTAEKIRTTRTGLQGHIPKQDHPGRRHIYARNGTNKDVLLCMHL